MTILELVTAFATSLERAKLLRGFLEYRQELLNHGLSGFQWINGSFTEDVERLHSRAPRDIDVVTFLAYGSQTPSQADIHRLFLDRQNLRATYGVDSYAVELSFPTQPLISLSNYWYGLWSHTRNGHSWKGFLHVPLDYAHHEDAVEAITSRLTEFKGRADTK